MTAAIPEGPALRSLRRASGRSITALAELLDVDEMELLRWEAGKVKPTPEQSAALLEVLGAPLDEAAELRRALDEWEAEEA